MNKAYADMLTHIELKDYTANGFDHEAAVSIPELAKKLDVDTVTIRRWVQHGRLEGVRLSNGRVVFPVEYIRAVFANYIAFDAYTKESVVPVQRGMKLSRMAAQLTNDELVGELRHRLEAGMVSLDNLVL